MNKKIFLTLAALLLSINAVFALPTLSSVDDQSFDRNQNITQARDILLTDDAENPVITAAGDIRIHIPDDFPLIWDNR